MVGDIAIMPLRRMVAMPVCDYGIVDFSLRIQVNVCQLTVNFIRRKMCLNSIVLIGELVILQQPFSLLSLKIPEVLHRL